MWTKRINLCKLPTSSLIFKQNRCETAVCSNKEEIPKIAQWGKVLKEAETIVGYPTSFMNLRWLLSDEFANMALYLRKIVGSNHPILHTAKDLIYNEHDNLQPWGLVILLLAKALKNDSTPVTEDKLFERQRNLAELTEIIRTGNLIHTGAISLTKTRNETHNDHFFGNKIAILIGDYLFITANGMLARLRNFNVSLLISTGLRDISEGVFFGPKDKNDNALPGRANDNIVDDIFEIQSSVEPIETENVLGRPVREWTVRNLFRGATLLGRGCEGVAVLAEESESCQKQAFLFGCNLNLAWRAAKDYEKFTDKATDKFSLVSAPVLFALEDKPDLYDYIAQVRAGKELNYAKLKEDVLRTNALERTKVLKEKHLKSAEKYIDLIARNESADAIKKIIKFS